MCHELRVKIFGVNKSYVRGDGGPPAGCYNFNAQEKYLARDAFESESGVII